jgi:hypothetical protein
MLETANPAACQTQMTITTVDSKMYTDTRSNGSAAVCSIRIWVAVKTPTVMTVHISPSPSAHRL